MSVSLDMKVINLMPRLVRIITTQYPTWLVGGSADPHQLKPKDYDIVVSHPYWQQVCLLIPKDAKPNLFGGFKFMDDGKEVDVWMGDIGSVFLCCKCDYAYQPKYDILLARVKGGRND